MKLIVNGITRTVFILKNVVVKVPNVRYGWRLFLRGLLSNIDENRAWKNTKSELLCPVLFCSWGGWFLIMQKVEWVFKNDLDYSRWTNGGFGTDNKPDNFGFLNGKIVKIDYD